MSIMSLNANLVPPPPSPQQQDTGLHPSLPPATPDAANASEPDQSQPVLNNRAATNSSERVDEINQPSTPIVEHSAPEKSDRSTSAGSEEIAATSDDEVTALINAASSGDAESQFNLAFNYYFGRSVAKDKGKAFEYFHKAAVQGHLQAQCKLGHMYSIGLCVKKNKEKAFEWFYEAAANGSSAAQFALGNMYIKGDGVKKSKEKAFQWFYKAAEKSHAEAQSKLGRAYSSGIGVEVDKEKAFEWFQKAAKQGESDAMKSLCDFYIEGQGVEKNLPLAAYWKLKSNLAFDGAIEIDDGSLQLIAFFPGVLEKFPEFDKVARIDFQVELEKPLNDELATSIVKFIRSNSHIKILTLDVEFIRQYSHIKIFTLNCDSGLGDDHVASLVEAFKFNTRLTQLVTKGDKYSKAGADQIEVLLTQNRNIAELRQYVQDHPLISTVDIPTDVIKILEKQIIVSYLKSGQTKEATRKAIDEFLIIASTTALAKDSKLN
jgi:TPR repeat protein